MSSSVHRISVREMNEIRSRRQLAVMNRLFQQWQALSEKRLTRNERTTHITTAYQKLREKYDKIAQFSSRELNAFNQEMASFTVTLNSEMRQIREQFIEEQAIAARSQYHRQRNLAELLERLQQQAPHEIALIAELQNKAILDDEQMASLIFRAMTVLENAAKSPAETQNELLTQLKAQSEGKRLFWQSGGPQSPFAIQCEQIALMIEKLNVLGCQKEATLHTERLTELQSMPENAQRQMSADSLIMVMAEQLRDNQKHLELIERLAQVRDELASFENVEFASLLQQADQASRINPISQIERLIEQIEAAIEQAENAIIIRAQRETILEGLSKLGYEVRENSVTSWLENGQVVITHPATPGYGLELGGKQTRFQARTVAFSSQRDNQRDHDVDAIWCNQHQQLQDILAQSDAELMIDRALPAGSGEMKVVEITDGNEQSRNIISHLPHQKTLR
ncbi:hypothetical protein G3341_10360 [Providencia vermicola]|uniref:hypothetical protein n=1 Tax=Providencia vermicola TaxID=333965 RepID=UPI0013A7AFF3|nr:hypothetical protein [Providencia vermicola]QIC16058.1 hypothetical protein G3341_10360 [Providencia vermicola]